jgi:hypothetical protein
MLEDVLIGYHRQGRPKKRPELHVESIPYQLQDYMRDGLAAQLR